MKYKWDTSKVVAGVKKTDFEWEIPHDELDFDSQIGEGCFGTVWKGKWRGKLVAVKELKSMADLSEFKDEVSILAKLRHPNVILLMGACTEAGKLCFVTEFMKGGALSDYVNKGEKHNFKTVVKIAKQTAFGLNYLHLSNIIHRDLKPDNLLIDYHFNVKLADFGLSTVKPKSVVNIRSETIGTPIYRAPEMMMENEYNEKVDMYAYGITMWEIFVGQPFLQDESFLSVENYNDLMVAVIKEKKRPKVPTWCPQSFKDILVACWDGNPKRRPNSSQIIPQLEKIADSLSTPAADDKSTKAVNVKA